MLAIVKNRKNLAKKLLSALLLILPVTSVSAKNYSLKSPDGTIEIIVSTDKKVRYQVKVDGNTIIEPSLMAMTFADGKNFGDKPKVIKAERHSVKESLIPVVAVRTREVVNHYNQLTLSFTGDYSLSLRAFDQGLAYRFGSRQGGKSTLLSEVADFNFVDGAYAYFPFEKKFNTATQPRFTPIATKGIDNDELGSLPALFVAGGVNVLVTETDLQSFPGLWLRGRGDGSVYGVHPADLDKDDKYTQDLGVVSKDRNYPWRIIGLARTDAELLDNQMSYLLAEPSRLKNTEWIKPGQIAWDWYNENNLKGVDFVAGINTDTYKYYIDFAAEYGIENILIDDGWSSHEDVLTVLPNIDVEEIARYGKEKGIGVQLWVPWYGLDKNMEQAFKLYAKWASMA